jgi:hypothetical protein
MPPPPNGLYTAFSFIGFVFCVIPFYWHLEGKLKYSRHVVWNVLLLRLDITAWNTGTCLYMVWTGLGCLLQCINSIVWNKNMINRAPIYCDICKTLHAFKSSLENSWHSPFFASQQPVFKSRLIPQYQLVHFASTAAYTRLLL